MATLFQVEVVTPERRLFTMHSEMVIATTTEGEIGIMAKHQAMVAALKPCVVKIRGEHPVNLAVGGGFMEMTGDTLTILAPSAERGSEIDLARAEAARARAEERLKQRNSDLDITRAEAALGRAMARLQAVREK